MQFKPIHKHQVAQTNNLINCLNTAFLSHLGEGVNFHLFKNNCNFHEE